MQARIFFTFIFILFFIFYSGRGATLRERAQRVIILCVDERNTFRSRKTVFKTPRCQDETEIG